MVAPATSMTAPEVSTSERTNGSLRTPSRFVGRGVLVLVRASWRVEVAAQAGHQHARSGEGEGVERRARARARRTAARRRRAAGPISWPISRTAPKRPLAAFSDAGVTTAGSSAQVAGRSSALPSPAARASAISGDGAVGEDQAGEGERADQLGGDRAAEPAGAVDQPAEQRAEQHRGGEVGDQHRGRAPGRAELLVGEQQERDVAGAGAERALQVGGEEPAGAVHGGKHRRWRQWRGKVAVKPLRGGPADVLVVGAGNAACPCFRGARARGIGTAWGRVSTAVLPMLPVSALRDG